MFPPFSCIAQWKKSRRHYQVRQREKEADSVGENTKKKRPRPVARCLMHVITFAASSQTHFNSSTRIIWIMPNCLRCIKLYLSAMTFSTYKSWQIRSIEFSFHVFYKTYVQKCMPWRKWRKIASLWRTLSWMPKVSPWSLDWRFWRNRQKAGDIHGMWQIWPLQII